MRILVNPLLALFLSVLCFVGPASADNSAVDASGGMVVYYFHRTGRCHTCLAMEAWTRQVVKSLASGDNQQKIVLNAVNLDLPENEHYAKDFQITFSTVVLAEFHDGKPTRWKNLADIWDFSSDEPSFKKYVENELATF